MRITDIELENYRAFYGNHHIYLDKDGKNLMVYGENGSGKSSLFSALQKFFKSSVDKVDVEENIFIPAAKKDTAKIKITIKENATTSIEQKFELNNIDKQIIGADKTVIVNANKIKGFFDYRSLLETHLSHKEDDVNIFKMLIENILPHAINRFTGNEFGMGWADINLHLSMRKKPGVVQRLNDSTEKFSKGFKVLLETIEADTNTFLKYFDKSISVKIAFDYCGYDEGDKWIYGDKAILKLKYAGKEIPRHQLFLNEARLSALAISLYLASVKSNPLTGVLKILVLDDLLIGLDMSNRLPLLSILKDFFINIEAAQAFQIVMTTYDKVWFDLVCSYFGTEKWKYVEIYSKKLNEEDFEIPIIKNSLGYIETAKKHLAEKDNKAAAVYIRTEFERIVMDICKECKLQVVYKLRQKDFKTDDLWDSITTQTNLDVNLIKEIETHRGTVMNPFSHFDIEKPEFEGELINTIIAIEKLKDIKPAELKKISIKNLKKEILELKKELVIKQIVSDRLRNKLKASL